MSSPQQFVLCHYRYDPLDRLSGHTPAVSAPLQRFYCKTRVATEIDGAISRSIVQHGDQLLAQSESSGTARQATLLATDQQRSVLHRVTNSGQHPFAYAPYGHRPASNGLLSLLGFNGERPDPVTGHYLLGNGYRAFNPVLMRFNSPDNMSPFGKGGVNPYAYCAGNPINNTDPSGHASFTLYAISKFKILGRRQRIKTFEKTRSFGDPRRPHPELTANQAINLYDKMGEAAMKAYKYDLRNALIQHDYDNRTSPILKNIASKAVTDHKLPLDSLPNTLKRYAEFPTPPLNSRDLIEYIADPEKISLYELHKIATGTPTTHTSGRMIDIETAKAYQTRIESIRKVERRYYINRAIEISRQLFQRY